MKKPFVVLWLLGILALCLPAAYLANVNANTYAPPSDFNILVPATALGLFIILGACCWLVYYFMKRRKRVTAVRDALLVFTVLVFLGIIGVAPEATKKMQARKRFLYREEDRKEFIKGCVESGSKQMLPLLEGEVENPAQTLEDYCTCAYDKMDLDPEVSALIDSGEENIQDNPRVRAIMTECLGDLLNEPVAGTADTLQ